MNEVPRAGKKDDDIATRRKPYRLKPVSLGAVVGSCDLDKALRLADRLEDEEIARKLQLRK